jgi:hypothetical protein
MLHLWDMVASEKKSALRFEIEEILPIVQMEG